MSSTTATAPVAQNPALATRQLKRLQSEVAELQQKVTALEKNEDTATLAIKNLQTMNHAQQESIVWLKAAVKDLQSGGIPFQENTLSSMSQTASNGENLGLTGSSKDDEIVIVKTESVLLGESKPVQEAISKVFFHTMSIDGKSALPNMPAEGEEVPVVGNEPVIRFDFVKTTKQSEHNKKQLRTITSWIHRQLQVSSDLSFFDAVAYNSLHQMSKEDIKNRVEKRFTTLRATYLQQQRSAAKVEGDLTADQLRARAKGKCDLRMAQRSKLPADSKWREAKYSRFFVPEMMSEDEDQYEEGKKTGRFVSRPPSYGSDIRRELVEALAEINIEVPKKGSAPTIRIRGPPKNKEPPRFSIEKRTPAWLVNANDLAANPEWLESKKVAPNGKLWGDLDDPVSEDERPKKRVKIVKKEEIMPAAGRSLIDEPDSSKYDIANQIVADSVVDLEGVSEDA